MASPLRRCISQDFTEKQNQEDVCVYIERDLLFKGVDSHDCRGLESPTGDGESLQARDPERATIRVRRHSVRSGRIDVVDEV